MALFKIRWKRTGALRDSLMNNFIGSREPFKCIFCSATTDVGYWRELKWLLLGAIDKDASRRTVMAHTLLDGPQAQRVYGLKCLSCNRLCSNKENTINKILEAIDELPLDI